MHWCTDEMQQNEIGLNRQDPDGSGAAEAPAFCTILLCQPTYLVHLEGNQQVDSGGIPNN